MTNVLLYTAVISGCAAVAGAAIPTFAGILQSGLAAKRDRQERLAVDKRQACVELVQAAENLRSQIASNFDYNGDQMGARLAKVRAFAGEARVQSIRISLMASRELAKVAEELSASAERLAVAAEASTDLRLQAMNSRPDFSDLETQMAAFSAAAVKDYETKKG